MAISTQSGLTSLNFYEENIADQTASIVNDFRPTNHVAQKKIIPVCTFAIIENFQPLEHVSIIKIDVEGGELDVIQSSMDIIKRDRPFVICEILPIGSETNTFRYSRAKKIETIFKSIDYSFGSIEMTLPYVIGRGVYARHLSHIEKLDELPIREKITMEFTSDYLFGSSAILLTNIKGAFR